MGRHATPDPEPAPDQPTGNRLVRHVVLWLGRIGLGLVVGAGTLGVLRWAGTSWTASLWIGATAAVVVLVAAWLASTVPGHDGPR
ncbi:hypothetical protein [Cellulomonas sp.]|uniref:hypothetical protein n=1 Tax=Cellulomonas sp. TaxID=40001 RepID=UPI003BA8A549